MRSRFARVRVRPTHRDEKRSEPRAAEWLLIEWPRGEPEPTKYWLSTLPPTIPIADLVRLAKLRWRIERDYQELKDELGLDHFGVSTAWGRRGHRRVPVCEIGCAALALYVPPAALPCALVCVGYAAYEVWECLHTTLACMESCVSKCPRLE